MAGILDPYNNQGVTYPNPSDANAAPRSGPAMPPQEDPGFFAKITSLLSRVSLPDSGGAAGRTRKKVDDTPEEISDRSRGSHSKVTMDGDTYAITPEEWDARINGTGPEAVAWRSGVSKPISSFASSERDAVEMGMDRTPSAGGGKGGGGKAGTPRENLKRRARSEAGSFADSAPRDRTTDALEALLKRAGGKADINWAPVIGLVDSWTGSNLLRGYEQPETQEEKDQKALALRTRLLEHEDTLESRRAALAQRAREAQDRLDQKDADNQMKLLIAQIAAGSRERVAETKNSGKPPADPLKSPARRNAVKQIALAIYGNPEDQYDPKNKASEAYVPAISLKIAKKGQELEESGKAEEGKGYDMALETYMQMATAPKPEAE